MKVVLFGTPKDARGFALAGVSAQVPKDAAELERGLISIARAQPPVGLVVVSAEWAKVAAKRLEALAAQPGPPAWLVLPDGPDGDGG